MKRTRDNTQDEDGYLCYPPPRKPSIALTLHECSIVRESSYDILPPKTKLTIDNIESYWTQAEQSGREEVISILYGWWLALNDIYRRERDLSEITV